MADVLLHIGAGPLQRPGLAWAREAGLHIIGTDRATRPAGRDLVDRLVPIAGDDLPGLLALAHEIAQTPQMRLVGAYASSDFGLPAVAAICDHFGLPGCGVAATSNALDKAAAKEILRAAGIGVPGGQRVKAGAALGPVDLPVVVKPADSSGSCGVLTARTGPELEQAVAAAGRFSEDILIEPLIEGAHIDVNGLMIEGSYHPGGQLDRFFSPPPHHVPQWGCQPALSRSASERAAIDAAVAAGAHALGIRAGPIKADVIWSAGRPVVLELAPRFHGDVSTSFVTPLACGRSPIADWFAYLASRVRPKTDYHRPSEIAVWQAIFPPTPGRLMAMTGLDAARDVPGITQIQRLKPDGTEIETLADNRAVLGFLWAKAATLPAAREALSQAASRIRVTMPPPQEDQAGPDK